MQFPIRSPGMPAAAEAHVWLARLENLPLMEPDVPARLGERLSQQRMGQKFLLRLLLGAYLEMPGRDVELARGRHGKPCLGPSQAGSGLTFNLSHAGRWLAIAVGRNAPLGIDIEQRGRKVRWRALARRWFSRDEADWLETLDSELASVAFLHLWTRREAIIKAMGETIAGHISAVVLAPGESADLVSLPSEWPPASGWSVLDITSGDPLLGCLASPEPLQQLRRFELEMPGTGLA
ncbi:MAG: 4'-phosphopantetheinyl transferase superfamily protein [Wenzhouxiangellaceae bacterium]|nr:4'-phosphopantetheinyl transferase superfamily protein [Wenzhouxiangellaceae bacterium]